MRGISCVAYHHSDTSGSESDRRASVIVTNLGGDARHSAMTRSSSATSSAVSAALGIADATSAAAAVATEKPMVLRSGGSTCLRCSSDGCGGDDDGDNAIAIAAAADSGSSNGGGIRGVDDGADDMGDANIEPGGDNCVATLHGGL